MNKYMQERAYRRSYKELERLLTQAEGERDLACQERDALQVQVDELHARFHTNGPTGLKGYPA